ncbi:MAG: TIGR04083 family peptide-modifying radical SAM enzyme [Microscillaceae bacterium]
MWTFRPVDRRFAQVETLVVKVTHRCNLDCLYCYENILKKGPDMPLALFAHLAEAVCAQSRSPEITFLFHGGEPSLLSNDWYEAALATARQQSQKHQKQVHFSIQTNLQHLSAAKIDLYKKHRFQIGISLDGFLDARQSWRGPAGKVLQNYQKLKAAGLQVGVLSTIHIQNFDKFPEICRFLHQEMGLSGFKANMMLPVGQGKQLAVLPPEAVFQAQVAILDYMMESQGQFMEYNLQLELERYFGRAKPSPTLCHEQQCGAGSRVLGISPQGDLLPCGRFEWNDPAYFLGHLKDPIQAASQKAFARARERFMNQVPENWLDCPTCPAKKICRFGCQAFILRSSAQVNLECKPTKMRYQFFRENEADLQKLLERGRSSHPPARQFRIKDKKGQVWTYSLPSSSAQKM